MKRVYLILSFAALAASCAGNPASGTSAATSSDPPASTSEEAAGSSSEAPPSSEPSRESSLLPLTAANCFATVYGAVTPNIGGLGEASYTLSSSSDGIRIDGGSKIVPIKADTVNEVLVTSSDGRTATFSVTVRNRAYASSHASAEASEGWFDDVSIAPVTSMDAGFANGMDISSCKQLYDNGQRFYNADGIEQSLFYILKDAGVNYIRLRLWNDPKDTYLDEQGNEATYLYGGGNCDLEHVSWMAHEAKAAGLKVLLNFQFSDFWSDPSNQVIPKAWASIATVEELAATLKAYVTDTLTSLQENEALPDMVQIGNETYSGLMIHNPGPTTTAPRDGQACRYHDEHTERQNGTQARYGFSEDKSKSANLRTYVQAAIEGIDAVDPSIQKMVHFVKGFADPNTSITFFKTFDDLDIDVYGLSAYSYYHFGNMSTLRKGLSAISSAFPSKKICLVETSYGFTYESDPRASNVFSLQNATCKPVSGYPCSIQGQASMIRDMSEAVAELPNGLGIFYWEGAWTPTKSSGWADSSSLASWANQALFSYNGKALGSLAVYRKMLNQKAS